jgi:hypothetical protein
MAKDVAQRELDQAGFRISNLGNPTAAGDATKTDNSTVPRANGGSGSPGTSLLAAPADHVHPAGTQTVVGRLVFDDPTEQSVSANATEVVAEWVVDFDALGTPSMSVSLDALVKAAPEGLFAVKVGGTPGLPDGNLMTDFGSISPTFEQAGSSGGGLRPSGLGLLKITAQAVGPTSVVHIKGKTVILTGSTPGIG